MARMPRPTAYTRKPDAKYYAPSPVRHRKKRKRYLNLPDSEKKPIQRPEMDTAELIAWAFENGRVDILASFGIHLSPETFEP